MENYIKVKKYMTENFRYVHLNITDFRTDFSMHAQLIGSFPTLYDPRDCGMLETGAIY